MEQCKAEQHREKNAGDGVDDDPDKSSVVKPSWQQALAAVLTFLKYIADLFHTSWRTFSQALVARCAQMSPIPFDLQFLPIFCFLSLLDSSNYISIHYMSTLQASERTLQ